MKKLIAKKLMLILVMLILVCGSAVADDGVQSVKSGGQSMIVKGDQKAALAAALLDVEKNAVMKVVNMVVDQNDDQAALKEYFANNYQLFVVGKPVVLSQEQSGGMLYVVANVQLDTNSMQHAVKEQVKIINAALKASANTKANVALVLRINGTMLMSEDEAVALVQSSYLENLRASGIIVVSADSANAVAITKTAESLDDFQAQVLTLARANPGWTYLDIGQINLSLNDTLNGYQAVASVEMFLYDNKKQTLIKKYTENYSYSARTMQFAEIGILTKTANSGSRSLADYLTEYYLQEIKD
ncbi:MAG: hypothetical protein WCV63_10660 [Negativicutes bacterium]|jgi:hypothetical protein